MCCRAAVEKTYRQMRASGAPDQHAYEAALVLYRYNHPEDAVPVAEAAVALWTGHSRMQ
ncbi:hypothetical protein [Azospirillum sp. B4]|nr:hypothetical protein [Azospirillum sp. B4]